MHGPIDFNIIAVTLIALVAVSTDLARGKIYNWLTLPALALGLVCAFARGGWSGGMDSLLGAGAGLFLYGWMFLIGMMGGGDVKLLMAFGAWGGLVSTLETSLLAVFLGGAMAFVVMVFTGRIAGFAQRMFRFLTSVFVRELELEFPKIDRKFTMPYGVPLSVAGVWVAWAHPIRYVFENWGLH